MKTYQGVGVSRSLLHASLFEHVSVGKANSSPLRLDVSWTHNATPVRTCNASPSFVWGPRGRFSWTRIASPVFLGAEVTRQWTFEGSVEWSAVFSRIGSEGTAKQHKASAERRVTSPGSMMDPHHMWTYVDIAARSAYFSLSSSLRHRVAGKLWPLGPPPKLTMDSFGR